MVYEDYKKSAFKHLKTCEAMIEAIQKLQIFDNTSFITASGKQPVLHNLFYLSGYVLESISTYSVYKHFGWNRVRSVKERDTNFSNICDFSFHFNHGYQYFVNGHQFQSNQFEVLKLPLNNSSIPFIDSSINVDLEMQALFNLWKPELRYHDSAKSYPFLFNSQFILSEANVFRFVDLTKQIYNGLLQIVG